MLVYMVRFRVVVINISNMWCVTWIELKLNFFFLYMKRKRSFILQIDDGLWCTSETRCAFQQKKYHYPFVAQQHLRKTRAHLNTINPFKYKQFSLESLYASHTLHIYTSHTHYTTHILQLKNVHICTAYVT